MIPHLTLGKNRFARLRTLKTLIEQKKIQLGGNSNLKIYGTLNCKSGKRLKAKNQVFFENEEEAIDLGYRPCGHCMREKYKTWKATQV